MATLFWIILTLCPFVSHSQSGDDGELIDTDCWSLMTLKQSSLICVLKDYEPDILERFVTLCPDPPHQISDCPNVKIESDRFTFMNLSPVLPYRLSIHLKGGRHVTKMLQLPKIVKITTPEIENATYTFDEAVIYIRHMHDYVKDLNFQLELWADHSKIKENVNMSHQKVIIAGEKLRDSDLYNVRVRAKPVNFFDGSWTEWSRVKSFKVNHTTVKEVSPVLYIFLCISPVLLVTISFLILRWKKEIQTCICPDIPDPKATLAQIHRQNEHVPVSFSPEIFKDIYIYPVIYTEEKQFSPDYGDDQSDTTESFDDEIEDLKCSPTSMCEKQDEDDQCLDSEISQLKSKLLDESASAQDDNNPTCQSVAALQRQSKDETYVTMSSLYKTQGGGEKFTTNKSHH